jgi:hypothetical protein
METIDIEKVEMKNLATDIRETCYKISRKPNLIKTSDDEIYDNFIDNDGDPDANTEILLERPEGNLSDRFFYVNLKDHFIIEIFKNLSEEPIYTQHEEDLPKLFSDIRPLQKKNKENFIQTETGDIIIRFGKSYLSTKISEDEHNRKI